jgi:alcohol dehydrogenase (cytochrome c)
MNITAVTSHSYRTFLPLVLFGLLICVGAAWLTETSQAYGQQSERVFTAAQATRGRALYARECASCHGSRLEGSPSTPLSGATFMSKWGDGKHSVDDFYFVIRTQMPYGKPGTLTNQQYLDTVAFILQSNGYQPGSKMLDENSASLKQTMIASGRRDKDAASEPNKKTTASGSSGAPANGLNGKPTQKELNAAHTDTTDWLMSNHDYGGQRFVDLKQITPQNVASLKPVARFDLGDRGPFHTNPVVSEGLMYITVKDSTIALDAVTMQVRWRYDRKPKGKEGWPMNRGIAIKDGKVIRGTHDGYLVALNAATGSVVWERALVDMTQHEGGFTMAPVVFEDLIIIGPAGSEQGVKGWVGAFRLSNGEPVWRFNTVPDHGEPGAETWEKADSKLKGGGAVWAPLSLDPQAGVVYVPVANPAPDFLGDARPGKNLYTCAMLALDARTGNLRWFYQLVPHDEHDWDTTQASPLFTTTIAGKTRKLVATSGKDGLLHVLDRDTHQQVYEAPITTRFNTDVPLNLEGVRACPGVLGGSQWNGPAFNPGTNMLYVNAVDWCGTFAKAAEDRYVEGQMYMGGSVRQDPPDKSRGWLSAIDASTGAVRWKYESKRPLLAAVTTTSANLIFTGELLGDFLALDAKNGEVLYRYDTGARMNGGVISYSINGKQYVAVATGTANGFWAVPPAPAAIIVFALPSDSSAAR